MVAKNRSAPGYWFRLAGTEWFSSGAGRGDTAAFSVAACRGGTAARTTSAKLPP